MSRSRARDGSTLVELASMALVGSLVVGISVQYLLAGTRRSVSVVRTQQQIQDLELLVMRIQTDLRDFGSTRPEPGDPGSASPGDAGLDELRSPEGAPGLILPFGTDPAGVPPVRYAFDPRSGQVSRNGDPLPVGPFDRVTFAVRDAAGDPRLVLAVAHRGTGGGRPSASPGATGSPAGELHTLELALDASPGRTRFPWTVE